VGRQESAAGGVGVDLAYRGQVGGHQRAGEVAPPALDVVTVTPRTLLDHQRSGQHSGQAVCPSRSALTRMAVTPRIRCGVHAGRSASASDKR